MKLSLRWIFDHIDGDWRAQRIEDIVALFNKTTAEIEHWHPIQWDVNQFFLADSASHKNNTIMVPELGKLFTIIEQRPDADNQRIIDSAYLVKITDTKATWATLRDFGVDRDGYVPLIDARGLLSNKSWRDAFQSDDVIIDVDNKSITHRPDMWGHRGFAREIAAFLKLPLKPAASFLATLPITITDEKSVATDAMPFIIENRAPKACKKFNGLYFSQIDNRPCNLHILSRLLKIGGRPINAIVDLTNYVAQDWVQPVHAYDAAQVSGKKVIIRHATSGESLVSLDGHLFNLTGDDLVVADAAKPMCLAGVKGGLHDGVGSQTTSIFFEAACFDATTVRLAALRHKTRTDSSARFEKTLDPNLAAEAVKRFVVLLDQCGIRYQHSNAIVAVGADAPTITIDVEHDFLERRSGLTLTPSDIQALLVPLEFGVTPINHEPFIYRITVPTFRSSKDISIKEDILEEVVRCFGFDKIPFVLPCLPRTPFSVQMVRRVRAIKHYLSFAASMVEQYNYALYDESSLKQLGIEEPTTVTILNPVSEDYARLVNSLVPGLCKNLVDNHLHQQVLNFFEWGKVWKKDGGDVTEHRSLAGVFYTKKQTADFYAIKAIIERLLRLLNISESSIRWEKVVKPSKPWYRPYQTAQLVVDNKPVGILGKADPLFISRLAMHPESDACFFELDGDWLMMHSDAEKKYTPVSRYPETFFDISVYVARAVTCEHLIAELKATKSSLIRSVVLHDFFEQDKKPDVRALTFRLWVGHDDRTLEKHEIDELRDEAIARLAACGAALRV